MVKPVDRAWLVRWSFLVGVVLLGSVATVAAAPAVIPFQNRKFDHDRHVKAASVAKDGKRQTAVCGDCHQMDSKGNRKAGKEHSLRCVKCHQDPKTCALVKVAGPASPARRCVVCHVPTAGTNCQPNDMPPQPKASSFEAHFSHGKHIAFGAAIEKECATCHKPQAPVRTSTTPTVVAHTLCADCHKAGGRSTLEMTNCAGCHQPPKGKAGPSADPFRLAKFDHRKHHTESNQASCTKCHGKMAGTGDAAVPRPSMLGCQTECHNGNTAFSATGTKCTTCHTSAGGPITPNRKDLSFSHTSHAARNVTIAKCEACHTLKEDGTLEPPGATKNHMPCAASGCHQTEFASKTTKICGVCHDQSVPWQKAVARANVPQKPEWFETMNHATHLTKKGTTNAACADCHGDKLGGGKQPGNHDACADCHGKVQSAHPMTQCRGCHTQTAPPRAVPTEWSVASTFVHDKHANDPRSKKASQCVTCHSDVGKAKDLASIKKPTMDSCGACHNGKDSFKSTGFECSRCHTKPNQLSTPTAFRGFIDNQPGAGAGAQAMLDVGPGSR